MRKTYTLTLILIAFLIPVTVLSASAEIKFFEPKASYDGKTCLRIFDRSSVAYDVLPDGKIRIKAVDAEGDWYIYAANCADSIELSCSLTWDGDGDEYTYSVPFLDGRECGSECSGYEWIGCGDDFNHLFCYDHVGCGRAIVTITVKAVNYYGDTPWNKQTNIVSSTKIVIAAGCGASGGGGFPSPPVL